MKPGESGKWNFGFRIGRLRSFSKGLWLTTLTEGLEADEVTDIIL